MPQPKHQSYTERYAQLSTEIASINDLEVLASLKADLDYQFDRVRKASQKRPEVNSRVSFKAGSQHYSGVVKRIANMMASIETEGGGYFPQVPVNVLRVQPRHIETRAEVVAA